MVALQPSLTGNLGLSTPLQVWKGWPSQSTGDWVGQESLGAPRGEEELLTLCSPDEPFLQAHQVIHASPRPYQGPHHGPVSTKMPTNEEVLKWYDILKECAISEKRLA